MTKLRIHRRSIRESAALSRLRAFDIEHRGQPKALLHRLEDKDIFVKQIAALALARLAELHPERLLREVGRLREALGDDSAYVRWHVIYALSKAMLFSPSRTRCVLHDLTACLNDENRIVREFASRALGQAVVRMPEVIGGISGTSTRKCLGL